MSISTPPGQPLISQTLLSSFRDAFALVKKNAVPAIAAFVLGFVAVVAVVRSGFWTHSLVFPAVLEAWITPAELAMFVLFYYSVAAAVRTINPVYRMTVGQFFGFLGYSLLAGLLTVAAGIFFVIPGYWVGVKVMFAPYTYIVTDGAPGALKRTWDMTTGFYWQTVSMVLLLSFSIGIIWYALIAVFSIFASAQPVIIIVLAPPVLAFWIWAMQVQILAYVRWTNDLLPRANMIQGVPVPA